MRASWKLLASLLFCSLLAVGTDTDGQLLEWTALSSGLIRFPSLQVTGQDGAWLEPHLCLHWEPLLGVCDVLHTGLSQLDKLETDELMSDVPLLVAFLLFFQRLRYQCSSVWVGG